MKLRFQLLLLCLCIIGTFSFSAAEMPEYVTSQAYNQCIEVNDSQHKDYNEKEFRKEEEENEQEENEKKDLSEDLEIEEEEPSNYSLNFSSRDQCTGKAWLCLKNQFTNQFTTYLSFFVPNTPPLYILFAALRVDC